MLERHPEWAERLMEALAWHRAHPFAWGRFDCATLYADAVIAVTGYDPLRRFRPWRDQRGAMAAVVRAGCRDVGEFIAATMIAIEPSAAQRGDFGYATGPRDRLQFPAVIVGAEAISRNEAGFVVFPRALIAEAWTL